MFPSVDDWFEMIIIHMNDVSVRQIKWLFCVCVYMDRSPVESVFSRSYQARSSPYGSASAHRESYWAVLIQHRQHKRRSGGFPQRHGVSEVRQHDDWCVWMKMRCCTPEKHFCYLSWYSASVLTGKCWLFKYWRDNLYWRSVRARGCVFALQYCIIKQGVKEKSLCFFKSYLNSFCFSSEYILEKKLNTC